MMIFLNLLTWGLTIFSLYVIIQRIWWTWLDHQLLKFTKDWPGLNYPLYDMSMYRDTSVIHPGHILYNKVIYYPFVYKNRRVIIKTSNYNFNYYKWRSNIPNLLRQYVFLV